MSRPLISHIVLVTDGTRDSRTGHLHAGSNGVSFRGIWVTEFQAISGRVIEGHKTVDQVPGSWLGEVLERAFHYWKNIDTDVGRRIEAKVRAETVGG